MSKLGPAKGLIYRLEGTHVCVVTKWLEVTGTAGCGLMKELNLVWAVRPWRDEEKPEMSQTSGEVTLTHAPPPAL